jgi:hypothetical protein
MAKITMTLCDVAPCTFIAEREFEVNGQTIYVCGENCFVKFWSREYRNWKNEKYDLEAHLNIEQSAAEIKHTILNDARTSSSDLQVLKPIRQENLRFIERVQR